MTQSSPDANSFPDLVELDALRLTVIVDNEVDFMSSCPRELNHTTQAQTLFKDKRNIDKERSTVESDTNAGDPNELLVYCYYVQYFMLTSYSAPPIISFAGKQTGTKDNVEHRVLFDTGPHSAIFLENAKRLEVEFEKIEVIVLSHWHIDHSGGMLTAVDKIQEARSKGQGLAPVVVDLHPDRPDERGIRLTRPSGSHEQPDVFDYVAWGKDPSFKELEDAGAKVSQSSQAHTVCDGFFGVSGVIPRMTAYETGLPNHARWSVETKLWKQEQEIMDERYLVARVKSKGIVVLTGCSHAGVINVCQDVKRAFQHGKGAGNNDLHFVVGGFHLAGLSMETRIKETVSDMLDLNPSFMAPGHCSGWRAKAALEQAMPGKVVSLGVGSDFLINHHGS
ncbi:hypothetical protein BGZ54_002786 [Gamsiella multidivaricata]|nr:hypothetical protein BGZ54_002786 [Gamsiella multidivaricata]